MDLTSLLRRHYALLGDDLVQAIETHGTHFEANAGTTLLREGQYVKVVPLVLQGTVKVFSRTEEKELLLYYIRPSESCVMSFAAGMGNEPSKIMAITEEDTQLLLLPVEKIREWVTAFPRINLLFFNQYNQRYAELIDTINQLLFHRLDGRVYAYLKEQARLRNTSHLDIRHRQIARDLGTAREVITRVMKRLEQEGRLRQADGIIELC
ncbi:MAG: Crp/Fnr family transcriptional regulator [Chitinophagaceae bacterium]|jgi:CRP/FNR family transcriptional regulator|nr:Crp/Fnr family transcriptional regulator [Chitinophagaceae bacterium]